MTHHVVLCVTANRLQDDEQLAGIALSNFPNGRLIQGLWFGVGSGKKVVAAREDVRRILLVTGDGASIVLVSLRT